MILGINAILTCQTDGNLVDIEPSQVLGNENWNEETKGGNCSFTAQLRQILLR
jgi:hypothetical protein